MKKTETRVGETQYLSSKEYGQTWKVTGSYDIVGEEIPTFAEIDSKAQTLKKMKITRRKEMKENCRDFEGDVSHFFLEFFL